ncbi:MAG: hypothetical protein M3228_03115 [Actinomycetota bacterium]|nr:hypothetical protein [Actinomycetota bacterium]
MRETAAQLVIGRDKRFAEPFGQRHVDHVVDRMVVVASSEVPGPMLVRWVAVQRDRQRGEEVGRAQ